MPENPTIEPYVRFLRSAEIGFSIAPDLVRGPDHCGALLPPDPGSRRIDLADGLTVTEQYRPQSGLGADHSTFAVAAVLARLPGMEGLTAVDLGCGSGVLGIVAALRGARVVGTDIDPAALALTRLNAEANRVEIACRHGSLCDPLGPEPVDLFVANLPHKPCPDDLELPLAQCGGPEGDRLFSAALPEMVRRQGPGGRLVFSLHSLPHPRLLRSVCRFYELTLMRWELRWMAADQYPQLRQWFRRRHREGRSLLVGDPKREGFFTAVWLGRRIDTRGPGMDKSAEVALA